jgi:hypothetical protein
VQGEAGGFFVESDAIGGRRAYMKPLRSGLSRAAREKIASDLAFDLAVPVPPALLATRDGVRSGEERFVCVSLVLFPQQYSWRQVQQHVSDPSSPVAQAVGNTLAEDAALGLAFDTWLAQGDHNDHPHNVVFGFDRRTPGSGSLVFLDYSLSMGCPHGWSDGKYATCSMVPFSRLMTERADKTKLEACICRIESYDVSSLEEVIMRIPGTHLPRPEGEKILESLTARRALVRPALAHLL